MDFEWDKNTALRLAAGFCITVFTAFCIRMLEWPVWQNTEFRFDNEMLLATHDAYHWVAGACGFGSAQNHPMSIMLKVMAEVLHVAPVQVAFWFPAVLASFVGGIVFLWSAAFGCPQAGIAAGLITTISPGFLGRTLLGFYDTDLVTLFFPLLMAFMPALWCSRFLVPFPAALTGNARNTWQLPSENPDSIIFILSLAISGLFAWWTQQWHSVFPYLIRFNSVLLPCLAIALGPPHMRRRLVAAALAYAFPCGAGPVGILYIFLPICLMRPSFAVWRARFLSSSCLCILWLLCLAGLAQGEILDTLSNQINAYLKHSGDAHFSGATSLVFPSVAQSIIEIQDLSFTALFPYFHPWLEASLAGCACFFIVIWRKPGALFLLPLMVLGILSSRLGGRMVMFGAPGVAIGLALPFSWLLTRLFKNKLHKITCAWLACAILCAIMVAPFLDMIPSLSQGPILNRRHAAALAQAGAITPKDAILWLWWDWGYAAHYFAHRQTIADGARHGGPSLYLPAAIFATDNARFARQIIRYASTRDNEPGNFFRDLGPDSAQELINRLRSTETPLVNGKGHQYVIVSFEMLKLGFWISNFGNWNFVTQESEGGALSIVPEAVAYRLNAGEVRLDGNPNIIFPASINVFAETGVIRRNYVQEWFATNPKTSFAEQQAFLASRRNINFLFNRVTDEKLAVDERIYNSLMVQLLLCDANDSRFAPYFRLVYDNVFTRIYEVQP